MRGLAPRRTKEPDRAHISMHHNGRFPRLRSVTVRQLLLFSNVHHHQHRHVCRKVQYRKVHHAPDRSRRHGPLRAHLVGDLQAGALLEVQARTQKTVGNFSCIFRRHGDRAGAVHTGDPETRAENGICSERNVVCVINYRISVRNVFVYSPF